MSTQPDKMLAALNESIRLVCEQQLAPVKQQLAETRAYADRVAATNETLTKRCSDLLQRIEALNSEKGA